MMIDKWKEVSRKLMFEKYNRGIERVDFELPDGRTSDFYIKKDSDVVCILAITEDGDVIVVEQFRPGPKKMMCEMPAGFIDAGEEPMEAARRELLEETGFTGDMEFAGACYADGYSPQVRHCFVAQNCKKVSEQELDEGEFLSIKTMPMAEFRKSLTEKNRTDTNTAYICMDYLNLL